MSDNVVWNRGVLIPMSNQLLADYVTQPRTPMVDAIRAMWEAEAEREQNGHIGPFHGPDRNDLWAIERKAEAREWLFEKLDDLMPGKRPGVFRRAS